jgi:hypothetical protein
MPAHLPETQPRPPSPLVDGGPVRRPDRHGPIDNDVILPETRPSDAPDVIMPGDREGDGRGPPIPMPILP